MSTLEYSKKILVAVSGLSPQILTETLYFLAVKQNFIPTEIHLITTLEGAKLSNENLFVKGKYDALCKEYQLPKIEFTKQNFHIIQDDQGNELNDIRTPEQNAAAADFMTNMIKEFTEDDDSAVHVSIAGGRKTMGYYLGYALSLFGRSQDRLSHVLVSEGYEGLRDFYYPSIKSNFIENRDTPPLEIDTSKAEVTLAEIPFIRMRQDIPKRLLQGKAGFSDTITLARKAELEPMLIVDVKNKLISASGEVFTMPPIAIAFYSWLLKQTVNSESSIEKPNDMEGNTDYSEGFLVDYRIVIGHMGSETTEDTLENGMEGGFFAERITRINKALKENLGDRLADSYKIKGSKHNSRMFYATDLLPEQVSFATIALN